MHRQSTGLAKLLRRRETEAEKALWRRLRNRQINGWKFRRQVPFGPYVLDFFCFDAKLVIEVDGATHSTSKEIERDTKRAAHLEANGLRVIRFSNLGVQNDIDGVLEMVYLAFGQQPAPSPGAMRRPLPEGRGDLQQAEA